MNPFSIIPSKQNMKAILHQGGFTLSEDQYALLWKYYQLIVEHNEECDLTRISRFDDFIVKHFVDSMIVSQLVEVPQKLLDIGTGAGFPGIPLKIIMPSISLILAEQRRKRVEFLKIAIAELGFPDVEIYPHAVTDHSFFNVDGVITRALESVHETLSRVFHFLPTNGKVIFMKGPSVERESYPKDSYGYSLILKKEYVLPHTSYQRTLLVYEKKVTVLRKTFRIFKDQRENREIVITSDENKKFKEWKKIVQEGAFKDFGITMVSGRRLVKERSRDGESVMVMYDGYSEDDFDLIKIVDKLIDEKRAFILKKSLFNELDVFNTKSALCFTPIPPIPQWKGECEKGCTLFVPFQDPTNVGSVIRSAVAFGIPQIVMLKGAAHPFHPRSIRASAGAVFCAPLYWGPGMEEAVMLAQCCTIVLDLNGISLNNFDFPESFCLLPGLEGPGIPQTINSERISIPIEGSVESLNATVAVSIALYMWRMKKGNFFS
ncbi:MAG: 16S rRNA (guanine(527)-N(7))-methyltransferase RsmG [Spirochaetes bacterium]|nr:16S rRNA (guanine(527)-N(7))-methyltransferase RsmG [Spirochaetota bacterium]